MELLSVSPLALWPVLTEVPTFPGCMQYNSKHHRPVTSLDLLKSTLELNSFETSMERQMPSQAQVLPCVAHDKS